MKGYLDLPADFLAGRYQQAAERLLAAWARRERSEAVAIGLVGALSFTGRLEEAQAIFASFRLSSGAFTASPLAVEAAYFFLAIGHTRLSQYDRARELLAAAGKRKTRSPLQAFYRHQGLVFYAYYTGRFRQALAEAKLARAQALLSGDLFARALATDALGHCRVVAGKLHHGLSLLAEAEALARRLGNESLAHTIAISRELYAAEFSTDPDGLGALERRFESVGTEDHYSRANVALELARQYTLRGRYADSALMLETAAPAIYASRNRRQEIILHLRLAELGLRQGELFATRQHLRFVDRLLHHEADGGFELAKLGLEAKLERREGRQSACARKLRALEKEFGGIRGRNRQARAAGRPGGSGEDQIHLALAASQAGQQLESRLRPLLAAGLIAAAAAELALPEGRPALRRLPGGLGLLLHSRAESRWLAEPLSTLQLRLLEALAGSGDEATKERLVREVWGYRYDPLRHDPALYTAISGLRKALGSAGEWLRSTETGYQFAAQLELSGPTPPEKAAAPAEAQPYSPALHHRQREILQWLAHSKFLGVAELRERFRISEITALRDFQGLQREGLVIRTGKARATRYSLAPKERAL